MTTLGILLFDDLEELDAIGPWEVFTMPSSPAPAAPFGATGGSV